MSDKIRFSVLLRPEERAMLESLSQKTDRSEGATIRFLIRAGAQDLLIEPNPIITALSALNSTVEYLAPEIRYDKS